MSADIGNLLSSIAGSDSFSATSICCFLSIIASSNFLYTSAGGFLSYITVSASLFTTAGDGFLSSIASNGF